MKLIPKAKRKFTSLLTKMSIPKTSLNYLYLVLCFSPIMIGLSFVYFYGSKLIFSDQWEIVPLLEKFFSNKLSFTDFFIQHNEHRILFPKVIILTLSVLTKLNAKIELYTIQFLLVLSLLVLFKLFNKKMGLPKTLSKYHLYFMPIGFLVFSPRQFFNFLCGFQLTLICAYFFSLAAFYNLELLEENEKSFKYIIYSVILAIVSSFSSFMGLITWPSGVFQIAISNISLKRKKMYLSLWFILGIITCSIFFLHYHRCWHHPALKYFLLHPLQFFQFFFCLLGSSLFWHKGTSFIAGVVIMLLFLGCIFLLHKHDRIKTSAAWLAINSFALLTLIAISIGRVGLGIDYSLESKYTTFSILVIISLYALIFGLVRRLCRQRYIKIFKLIAFPFIVTVLLIAFVTGLQNAHWIKGYLKNLSDVLLKNETYSDEFLKQLLLIPPDTTKTRIMFLKNIQYNIFNKS